MSRSRARLAADWFAKLRENDVTNVVEHTNVTDVAATALHSGSPLNAANLTGALPAIDGSALTGVGASTTAGAVGTYAFLGAISYYVVPTPNAPGGTLAGSSLRYKDADRSSTISPAGTWRIMGGSGNATYTAAPSVWLRIS